MANARQRAKDSRARRDAFYQARLDNAGSLVEKLEVAFGYLRANLVSSSDANRARTLGLETLDHLVNQAREIPRGIS